MAEKRSRTENTSSPELGDSQPGYREAIELADYEARIAHARNKLPYALEMMFDRLLTDLKGELQTAVKLEHRIATFTLHANNGTLPTTMTRKRQQLSLPGMSEPAINAFRDVEDRANRVYNVAIAASVVTICKELRSASGQRIDDLCEQFIAVWHEMLNSDDIFTHTSQAVMRDVDQALNILMEWVVATYLPQTLESERRLSSLKRISNTASKLDRTRVQDQVLAEANQADAPVVRDAIRAEIAKGKQGKGRAPSKNRTRGKGKGKGKKSKSKKSNNAAARKGGRGGQSH